MPKKALILTKEVQSEVDEFIKENRPPQRSSILSWL